MLLKFNRYSYLIFAVCFFTAAAIIERGLLREHPEAHILKEFQAQLSVNESRIDQLALDVEQVLADSSSDGNFFESLNKYITSVDETGTAVLVYHEGNLVFWSDRSVAFYTTLRDMRKKQGFTTLPNGYYLARHKKLNDFDVIVLHLIKRNYEHQNSYLHNTFYKSYKLPEGFQFIEEKPGGMYDVLNIKGEYLFSLLPQGEISCRQNQLYLPAFIYLIGLILLLFYFKREFDESQAGFIFKMATMATALFVVYWFHLIFKMPGLLSHLPFFSPAVFALNSWLPSLGDYFLIMLFFTFWLYIFTLNLNVNKLKTDINISEYSLILGLLFIATGFFIVVHYFVVMLIYNSTISFLLNRIIDITTQSILALFSVALALFSVLFLLVKIIDEALKVFRAMWLIFILVSVVLIFAFFQFIIVGQVYYTILLFFLVSAIAMIIFSVKNFKKLSLIYFIVFVSMASIYSLIAFYHAINLKERENQKLFAVTLVAERDPAAEQFLTKIEKQIQNDAALISLLIQKEDLHEYLQRTYFNGYFKKYLFEMYVCHYSDSLIIEPKSQLVPCMEFMDAMIKDMGVRIGNTGFYFMDNMNGRISYSGRVHFQLPNDPDGITIFIDLFSNLLFEGIGFPELLIDNSITRSEYYRKFNYAKYYGGELTDMQGDYNYNFYIDTYEPENIEFATRKWDGYEHIIYNTRENNFVIVSRKLFTAVDYLISFPYLFVFYFIVLLVLLLIGTQKTNSRKIVFDLKFKIQAAIISIVFTSLLVVALATIFYNIGQFQSKHRNDLNEKMKSISEEIDMRLENKDEITPPLVEWLQSELFKLSNIFQTDINIFGVNGDLLASSRPEIFERGLISTHMNSEAFFEIFQNFRYGSIFQPEKIGELSYLSVYQPIVNNRGQNLGAINLPYFIKQDKYSQEISTFIVAFINLYVLLLLASIVIAVFIANQITHPLVVIQEKLKKMELGKYNEPILYRRNDEIGGLVKEYNKKVDELAASAELLARSERESAWREMAKQIAHEIKNPLTPMKLNIQYLQHAKGRGKDYNEFIERVTSTLIEQIDNLSNIATEFSNFAQIPTARNQVFNLAGQLEKVIALFGTHDKATIQFKAGGINNVLVNADREQLSRAIINLIKNGIQAIPENEPGQITVSLNQYGEKAVIAVTDNGTGIADELQEKLFSPSFTTKTSGMGLGLAIVKNIAENFSGRVWFETEPAKGSTFYIEIPVYSKS